MKVAHIIQLAAMVATALAAVLAIDYGQEYTKAALLSPGINFEIVLTQDSKRKQPSAIGFKGKADSKFGLERVYGSPAVLMEPRFPSDVVLYHKRLLGGRPKLDNPNYKEYTQMRPACMAVPSNSSRSAIAFQVKDSEWSAEELLAMQISDIKSRADDMLKTQSKSNTDTVKDVVMTVPPHFTHSQRLALVDAVDLAGLKLIALVSDGTATAVNYVSTRKFTDEKEYHVVYDMGAGSASATLFSVQDVNGTPVIDIEGVGYDEALAGQDMTNMMVKILAASFMEQNKDKVQLQTFIRDVKAAAKLWKEAERAKAILSANQEVSVSIEAVHNGIDFKTTVTRDDYVRSIEKISTRLNGPLEKALAGFADSPVALKDVKSVILTGGVTRTPVIQEKLKELLGDVPISKNVNTDESIVLGSLLRGVGISSIFKSRDIKVIDRTPHEFDLRLDVLGAKDEILRSEKANVFSKGAAQGESVVSKLDISEIGNANLYLLEDGDSFVRLDVRDMDAIKKELNCEKSAELHVPFDLTLSGTIKVGKAKVVCKGGDAEADAEVTVDDPVEDVVVEEEVVEGETVEGDAKAAKDSKDSKDSKKASKKVDTSRYVPHKTRFVGTKPLTSAAKLKISGHLRSLARKDAERLATSDAANKLESTIYHIKHLIEDAVDQDKVADIKKKIEDAAAWFEEDGLTAGIQELTEKLSVVQPLEDFFKTAGEAIADKATAAASAAGEFVDQAAAAAGVKAGEAADAAKGAADAAGKKAKKAKKAAGKAASQAEEDVLDQLKDANDLIKNIAQLARESGNDVPSEEDIEREMKRAAEGGDSSDSADLSGHLETLMGLQDMLNELNGGEAPSAPGLDVTAIAGITRTIQRLSDKLTELGTPPKDEDDMFRMLGIDPQTFHKFSEEAFEDQASPADQLMDSIGFLQQVLAQDESPDPAALEKMRANIAERQERIAKVAEVAERNQKRQIAALENMLKNAEKTIDISIYNLKQQAPKTASVEDKKAEHDEL
ncbi:YALIA101S01e15016g1_1 [Yarrowia lipolytica]|nr:YALIA101S01e15016g1_1 [Yarrowia lipolytica]